MHRYDRFNRLKFNLYAPIYDLVGRWFMRARRDAFTRMAPLHGKHVLLCGAGTGLDLEFLKEAEKVTALDYSANMLRRLQSRAKKLNIHVVAVEGDAGQLPFAEGTFDVVCLHFVLESTHNPAKILSECVRVTKYGGQISLLDLFLPPTSRASIPRKVLHKLSFFWFSGWNIRAERLVEALPLRQTARIEMAWGGNVVWYAYEKVGML